MGAVRAEDEFELEKNGIDVATGQEKVVFEKVVIVLQPDFRELGRIPGQVRADARARLSIWIVGELRIGVVQVIAAHARDPAFLKPQSTCEYIPQS